MIRVASVILGIVLLFGCSKEAPKPEAKSSAAPAAATTAAGPEPVICCQTGAMKGTSTKSLCESNKCSKVVADSECPMLKK